MKRIVLLLLVVVVLVSCGGPSAETVDADRPIESAVSLGSVKGNKIYRFYDGPNVCYLSDGFESGGISCLPR